MPRPEFPPDIPSIGQIVKLSMAVKVHKDSAPLSRTEEGYITYVERDNSFVNLHLSCYQPKPRILSFTRLGENTLQWQCLWLEGTPHEVEITWDGSSIFDS